MLRHPPRRDDDGPRVHGRPAPARRAAQGSPLRSQRGRQPGADLDRSREGDRPRDPGSARQAAGLRGRRPGPDASLVDLTVELEHETLVQEINDVVQQRADHDGLRGHPPYSEDPLVSTTSSVRPTRRSSTRGSRSSAAGTQVKAIASYDNEWGYSSRWSTSHSASSCRWQCPPETPGPRPPRCGGRFPRSVASFSLRRPGAAPASAVPAASALAECRSPGRGSGRPIGSAGAGSRIDGLGTLQSQRGCFRARRPSRRFALALVAVL